MFKYPIETIKELKKIFPDNPEFHINLDNNSTDALSFIMGELDTMADEMKNSVKNRQPFNNLEGWKKLGDLFQSLSESGYPGD
jgi:hypothetical protein